MVIDLVIVTAPKPPGSMALISPPVAVLEIAPAKVLHGAVGLHGLAASPAHETQVRVAWAWTADAKAMIEPAVRIDLNMPMVAPSGACRGKHRKSPEHVPMLSQPPALSNGR